MLYHSDILFIRFAGRRLLTKLIRQNIVTMAGNRKLKIYGTLTCSSGKRMKSANRVFFANEHQAIENGYRPCGHCLRKSYLQWLENS